MAQKVAKRSFTIKEKAEIISKIQNGANNAHLSKEYNVGHSTISTIWKNRDKILECLESKSSKIKKNRKPTHPDIENALLAWLKSQSHVALSGPLLQDKANHFAKMFGKTDYKCSQSWISRFRRRYDIVVGKVCGSGASGSRSDGDNTDNLEVPKSADSPDSRNADETVSAVTVPSQDRDPLKNTIDQCRFCGEFCKECVPVSSMHLSTNTTTIAFNNIVVQLDFSDRTLPHTVCKHCDAKLQEMLDFVKLVKNAQKSLINVGENVTEVEVEVDARQELETLVVKTEYEESDEADSEDINENTEEDSKSGIVDSVTVGETVFIKENLGTQKRKRKPVAKNPKKAKAENKSDNESDLIIDIKEEVIEMDENDGKDTERNISDTGTDVKPSETELATSALVFEMRSDSGGFSPANS